MRYYDNKKTSKESKRILYQKGKIKNLDADTPLDKYIIHRQELLGNIYDKVEQEKIKKAFIEDVEKETEKAIKNIIDTIKIN